MRMRGKHPIKRREIHYKMAVGAGDHEFPDILVRAFLREMQKGVFPDPKELCERLRIPPLRMDAVSATNGLAMCANKHGDTPLLTAARSGELELVRTLLAEHGVPLEHTNSDGKTALHEAAQGGHVECVRLLLCSGANVDSLKKADW